MQFWEDDVILLELKTGRNKLKAFEQLFNKYCRLLCNIAFDIIKNEQECEDIVQELFINFYEKEQYSSVNIPVRNYLIVLCRNRCLNHLKARQRSEKKLGEYRLYNNTSIQPHFELTFQIKSRVNGEIMAMSPQQQKAFDLGFNQGKTYLDAASEMGVSLNTFKDYYKLALKKLRTGLADLL